jgi:hypothetical protein
MNLLSRDELDALIASLLVAQGAFTDDELETAEVWANGVCFGHTTFELILTGDVLVTVDDFGRPSFRAATASETADVLQLRRLWRDEPPQ